MKLSVIIPVYNEEMTIGELLERVLEVDLGNGVELEIVIANDGSTDDSASIIQEKVNVWPNIIKVFSSPINLGKGAAVRSGIDRATGDFLLIQDADLELNPAEYRSLLEPILAGQSKIVYGSRFLNGSQQAGIPRRTRLANKLLTMLTNLLFMSDLTDMETAYKLFSRDTVEGSKLSSNRFDFEPEITGHFLNSIVVNFMKGVQSSGNSLFSEKQAENIVNRFASVEEVMNHEDKRLNQRLTLLATDFTNGFEGKGMTFNV
jgi:glycosyltransferase involved in cell wall biosynthesis